MYQFSKRQFFWVCTLVFCAGLAVAQQLREGTLRVQESVENMRDAPNGRKVGTLLEGTEIEEISRDGKWVRFRIEGVDMGPFVGGLCRGAAAGRSSRGRARSPPALTGCNAPSQTASKTKNTARSTGCI